MLENFLKKEYIKSSLEDVGIVIGKTNKNYALPLNILYKIYCIEA